MTLHMKTTKRTRSGMRMSEGPCEEAIVKPRLKKKESTECVRQRGSLEGPWAGTGALATQ